MKKENKLALYGLLFATSMVLSACSATEKVSADVDTKSAVHTIDESVKSAVKGAVSGKLNESGKDIMNKGERPSD